MLRLNSKITKVKCKIVLVNRQRCIGSFNSNSLLYDKVIHVRSNKLINKLVKDFKPQKIIITFIFYCVTLFYYSIRTLFSENV